MDPKGLGTGVVWWPPLQPLCSEHEGLVDVIELEPEAYWVRAEDGSGFRSFLVEACAHLSQPKLLHGVGAPLGGTCTAPAGHGETFAANVAEIRPPFVSEHLSITRFRPTPQDEPVSAGFMLPPLASRAGMEQAVENIRRRQKLLGGIPLAIETPVSYLRPAKGEWPDGVLITAVAETADCGILLDLHNVLCNARNGRQSVADFCNTIPLHRVWELHLAGGEMDSGIYLDAHSGVAAPELMEIAAELVARLPNLQTIIFEVLADRVAEIGLDAIARQLADMKDLWQTRNRNATPAQRGSSWPQMTPPIEDPEKWESLLGCAINCLTLPDIPEAGAEWWREAAPAIEVYRRLVGEGRASAVAAAAPHTTRLLLSQLRSSGTRALLADFWRQTPPAYTSADEARAFFRFVLMACPDLPGLSDAVAQDAAELAMASKLEPQASWS